MFEKKDPKLGLPQDIMGPIFLGEVIKPSITPLYYSIIHAFYVI